MFTDTNSSVNNYNNRKSNQSSNNNNNNNKNNYINIGSNSNNNSNQYNNSSYITDNYTNQASTLRSLFKQRQSDKYHILIDEEEEEEEEKDIELLDVLYDRELRSNNNKKNKEKKMSKKEQKKKGKDNPDALLSPKDTCINSSDSVNGSSSMENINLNNLNNNNNDNNNNNNNNNLNIPNVTLLNVSKKDEAKHEMQSMSKVINRSNNLTKSEPVSPPSTDNNNNNVNNNNSGANSSKYISPLSKAQELPYHQVSILQDSSSIAPEDFGASGGGDFSDEEEDEKKEKKKKKSQRFCTTKMKIIYILILLLLISAVGIVFRIFWPDVTIVESQILRWALFLDVAILSFLLASWAVRGFFLLFQMNLYLQQHVYYYIHPLINPLSIMIWAIACLFATGPILDLPSWTDSDMDKYYTTLRAIIYVSLFYCARVALVKILAAKTNRKAFYSSLKQSLLNEELLEQLSTKKSSTLSNTVSTSFKKKKKMGVSLWIDQLKSRNNLSGKLQIKADNYSHSDAKKVAKMILLNGDRSKKGYLNREDLKYYVKESHLDKAYATFGSLYDDMITRDDIVNWVLKVVRSRKTLEYRLRDHEDIGKVINDIISFIFWILMFLFVMTLYGYEVSVFLVPLSTTILALSFAFGTTLRNIFESLILIFLVRPFEVGDKIVVDNEALIVDRIGILFTSFKSTDGKAVYLPNPTLTSSKIENHQRSEEVWVGVDIIMNFATPVEKLYMLESKLDKWVKAQPEKWKPDTSLTFVNIDGSTFITIRYGASIIASWQDAKRWRPIKNELLFAMKQWISDLDLKRFPPMQQIQLVPVSERSNQPSLPTTTEFKYPDY